MAQLTLVVDDEPSICELVELTLERMGIESYSALTVADAKTLLEKHAFDLCLTDMRLPDASGLDLVRHLQQHYPAIPVAVMTAHGNMALAVETLKAGAFDFVSKPVDLQHLRSIIRSALRLSESSIGDKKTEQRAQKIMFGDSVAMKKVRAMILKLARNQAPVFISGESGTGKELAARLVHDLGPRADAPFIPVNCGAIPEHLMESEFFGHKKGSFTGAIADKKGLFLAANGGTLFLDEIADLPLPMQVKLLRVIQEKTVRAVGGEKEVAVDVRLLSASHKNLQAMVNEQHFREDLYYRLNVIELPLPSLRERPEDIDKLVRHLLKKLAQTQGIALPVLSAEAKKCLSNHAFPGNVRELENILERALAMSEQGEIQVDDLGLNAPSKGAGPMAMPQTNSSVPSSSLSMESTPFDNDAFDVVLEDLPPLEEYLENIERTLINKVLQATRYNKTATAKRLGISFNALRYRLKKLDME